MLLGELASDFEAFFVMAVASVNDGDFWELPVAIRDTILNGENSIFPAIGA
jgi:hypothetical protein